MAEFKSYSPGTPTGVDVASADLAAVLRDPMGAALAVIKMNAAG
jgi:hypothetical protein